MINARNPAVLRRDAMLSILKVSFTNLTSHKEALRAKFARKLLIADLKVFNLGYIEQI